jgi:ABC-type Na+ efflux pump permease subunit
MKGIRFPVLFVTIFLFVYVAFAYFSLDAIVMTMFSISPFLVIWMVYRVLKYGKPSGRTFSEHFYDDEEYKRVPGDD